MNIEDSKYIQGIFDIVQQLPDNRYFNIEDLYNIEYDAYWSKLLTVRENDIVLLTVREKRSDEEWNEIQHEFMSYSTIMYGTEKKVSYYCIRFPHNSSTKNIVRFEENTLVSTSLLFDVDVSSESDLFQKSTLHNFDPDELSTYHSIFNNITHSTESFMTLPGNNTIDLECVYNLLRKKVHELYG